MHNDRTLQAGKGRSLFRWIYLPPLFILALSGFAQMPIFKRYYIADIPGLGWLAQFYVTHYLHYLAAILFIALFTYIFVDYVSMGRKEIKLTISGYFRGTVLTGIIVSGLFLVIRNLSGTYMRPDLIVLLDLIHLGLVILFLFSSLYCLILKKKWTTVR